VKILFHPIMPLDLKDPEHVSDYQSDMVFHGLVKKLGTDVHTYHNLWWHHKKAKEENEHDFSKIWGKGFTIYGLLEEGEYQTLEMNERHSNYDAIVLPIHWTHTRQHRYIITLLKNLLSNGYEKKQLIVVDGWDRDFIHPEISKNCTYYKREMTDEQEEYAKPISFAFPEEKIRPIDDSKREIPFAPLIPVNQSIDPSYMSTYQYDTEQDYYDMYQTAYFSYTSKKGGWDTLRHYEIIANGSIPFFVDIEHCPKNILWNLPKERLLQARNSLGGIPNLKEGDWNGQSLPHCGVVVKNSPGSIGESFNLKLWEHYRDSLYSWLKREGTTTALAEYILKEV